MEVQDDFNTQNSNIRIEDGTQILILKLKRKIILFLIYIRKYYKINLKLKL